MTSRPKAAPFALAASVLGLLLTTACGIVSTGSSGLAATSAVPAAPVAAAWRPGGTYTGPVPPAGLLGPTNSWVLNPYTSPEGYKVQDDIVFGVPLHYAIPNQLFDCSSGDDSTADLPPGQYAVPFAIVIHNQTAQQARAIAPDVWIGSSAGGATLDISGGDMNGDDSGATWANGDCETSYYHTMDEGGSDALYGLIGPATPAQLAGSYVYESWAGGENNVPGMPPQLSLPLPSLLPHAGASWLSANTGTPLPSAEPSVSSSPTSCPSAPPSYDSAQQEAFNSGCDTWIGQVGQQLQFDPAGTPPLQDATDWCNQEDDAVSGTDTLSQLLPACLAGVQAAGGP